MIAFREVSKRFGDQVVLDRVSLTIERGQCLFVIGTSGAGKSVLVKHLVGLVRPDAGAILLDGLDVATLSEKAFYPVRLRCALVFQHATLFDWLTLAENVALPLRKHRGIRPAAALAAAREQLEVVQMAALADRYPAEVGDGLRKRVAIARALVLEPEYVVFDEPTTGLDPVAAANVDALIRDLATTRGVTCVVVSHDLRSIFTVADRVVMLHGGRVRLDGTPADFARSEDPVVRQFVRGLPEGPI